MNHVRYKKEFIPSPKMTLTYGHHEMVILVARLGMPSSSYLEGVSQCNRFFQKKQDGIVVLKEEVSQEEKINSLDLGLLDDPEIFDFLTKILVRDSKKRLTPQDALKHPLFAEHSGLQLAQKA